MNTTPLSPEPQEKTQLRDSIAREVKRYLEHGGNITVLDTPQPDKHPHRGSSWHVGSELDVLLD